MANLTTIELYKIYNPTTTLTNAQITAYIELTSDAIQTYLQRDLEAKTRVEWHIMNNCNTVMLDEYPVNKVNGVYKSTCSYRELILNDLPVQFNSKYVDGALIYTIADSFGDNETEFEIADYSDLDSLVADMVVDLEDRGVDVQDIVLPEYQNISLSNLCSIGQSQGHDNYSIYLLGLDKSSQYNYVKESDRVLIINSVFNGSANIGVKYNAGYTLPATTSYGTLPREINDVANRIVNLLADNDISGGANLTYMKEDLGKASYSNWSYENAIEPTYVYGLVNRFKSQLQRYKKKDCSFY